MVSFERVLRYWEYGWSVIPVHVPVSGGACSCGRDCSWPGKHPRIAWREYSSRRPTKAEITHWFQDEYYGSNVGLVTGTVSEVVVLDVDGELEHYSRLGLPRTLSSRTGSGGWHYFYRATEPVRTRGRFVPYIDLKAEGGFVVLPPSRHRSGKRYRWNTRIDPVDLPTQTLSKFVVPKTAPTSRSALGGADHWYDRLLQGVAEGDRSNSAARLAARYASLDLSITEASVLLSSWNSRNSPPLPEYELATTVRWAYERRARELADIVNSLSRNGRG